MYVLISDRVEWTVTIWLQLSPSDYRQKKNVYSGILHLWSSITVTTNLAFWLEAEKMCVLISNRVEWTVSMWLQLSPSYYRHKKNVCPDFEQGRMNSNYVTTALPFWLQAEKYVCPDFEQGWMNSHYLTATLPFWLQAKKKCLSWNSSFVKLKNCDYKSCLQTTGR